MSKPRHFDPDKTQRDDGPYWAAAMVLAIRDGDHRRAAIAQAHLTRLGYPLIHKPLIVRKGKVRHAR